MKLFFEFMRAVWAFLLGAVLCWGCEKYYDPAKDVYVEGLPAEGAVNVYEMYDTRQGDGVCPYAVVETSGHSAFALPKADDGMYRVLVLDFESYSGALLTFGNNCFYLHEYDPFTGECGSDVIFGKDDGENELVAELKMNWNTGKYDVEQLHCLPLPYGVATKDKVDEWIEDVQIRYLKLLSEAAKYIEKVPRIGEGTASAIKTFRVIIAREMYISSARVKREVYSEFDPFPEEEQIAKVKDGVVKLIPTSVNNLYAYTRKHLGIVKNKNKEEIIEDDGLNYLRRAAAPELHINIKMIDVDTPPKVRLTVSVDPSSITESSAVVSGSYQNNSLSIMKMGFVLEQNGQRWTFDSWEYKALTLSNLRPGTVYRVAAVAKTTGGEFYSNYVSFTTKGESPRTISFSGPMSYRYKVSTKWWGTGAGSGTNGNSGGGSGTVSVILRISGSSHYLSLGDNTIDYQPEGYDIPTGYGVEFDLENCQVLVGGVPDPNFSLLPDIPGMDVQPLQWTVSTGEKEIGVSVSQKGSVNNSAGSGSYGVSVETEFENGFTVKVTRLNTQKPHMDYDGVFSLRIKSTTPDAGTEVTSRVDMSARQLFGSIVQ